ncbi:MAG TPA: hypothetical protein VGZ73_14430 [Bryobacteraceae bacterium]|jgi:hypothetical protein|nr:hypothetical protein [Bryobacteraceae bacterium]
MPGATLVLVLEWVSLLGSLLIAVKLYSSGLHRRYRVFFAYFLFRVPTSAYPLLVDVKSPVYFYSWVFTEPFVWMFYVWVVLELCRLVLERHRGLYTLGKWAMYLGMAISVTLSVVSILAKFQAAPPQRSRSLHTSVIGYFYAADRGVTFCMAIFLLLMMLLLSRYPVRLSRNVVLHTTLYTIFFLSNTLGMILSSVFGQHLFTTIDAGLMGVSALSILAWLIFLNPNGEDVRVNIPHFAPEHEKRILYHLDALNSTLLKVSHKEVSLK